MLPIPTVLERALPTYEYACKECGEHTEAVQAFTDDPLTVCPNCGGPLRKVFGNIGIAFKGSGFYKNDSRSSTSSSSTTAASPKSDKGEGSTDTSTKTEPAAPKSDAAGAKAESKPAAAAS